MLDKIAVISFTVKKLCMILIIACVLTSVILGKSISDQAVFLVFIILAAFLIVCICLSADFAVDAAKEIKRQGAPSMKKRISAHFFPEIREIINEFFTVLDQLRKSDKKEERIMGAFAGIAALLLFLMLIWSIAAAFITL